MKRFFEHCLLIIITGIIIGGVTGIGYCSDILTSDNADHLTLTVEDLKLKVKPLMADELLNEVKGWQRVLKNKSTEISTLQIEQNKKDSAVNEADINVLMKLREERSQIISRMNAVLAEYAVKGGDAEPFKQYVSAVSGVEINKNNAFSNWLVVKNWCLDKDGGIHWLINSIKFVIIIIVFKLLAGIIAKVVRKSLVKSFLSELLKDFLVNTSYKLIYFTGIMIGISALGVDIVPLMAGVGVIGFVLGFALQDTLSNFASGFMLLMYRPYDIGDVISAAGITGKVSSMNLVSTSINTADNQHVIVPNSTIWGGVITNVTGNKTRRIDFVFGIGYDDNIEKAYQVLTRIIKDHNKILAEPETVIKVHELADSSVNFVCRPWVTTSDYWDVYWDITRTVKETFDKEGISFPYPQQDVHMHQVEA